MPDETTTTSPAPEAVTTAPEVTIETAAPVVETTPQPAATTEEPAKAPEVPPSIDKLLEGVSLADMSDAQLADLYSGDPARVASAIGAKAPEAKPESKPDTAPQKGKEAAPVEPEGEGGKQRVSLKALSPKSFSKFMEALQLVKDGKYADIGPAVIEVFGLTGTTLAAPEAPKSEPETPQAPEIAPEVKAIQDKIAEKEAELAEAETAYDYSLQAKLQRELGGLDVDLRFAKHKAEQQAQSESQESAKWLADEEASRARALGKYGVQMSDPESRFQNYVDFEIFVAERDNDNILSQPDWPEKIADRVQEKYFGSNGNAHSAQQQPASQIPQPPSGIRFPGSPVPSSAGTSALTAQAATVELDKLSAEERLAVMNLAQLRADSRRR